MSLYVDTEDEETAMRVWEVLNRTAMGIALDGVHVSLHVDRCDHTHDHDHDEVQP
jgi:hypothetical protein